MLITYPFPEQKMYVTAPHFYQIWPNQV